MSGPAATVNATMILDTGATTTFLSLKVLRLIGYDPSMAIGQAQLITGSARFHRSPAHGQSAPRTGPARDWIAGARRNLPSSAAADGLLGLDFVRGHVLTIDFPQGQISLV